MLNRRGLVGRVIAAVSIMALVAAACGGDDATTTGPESTPTDAPTTSAPATVAPDDETDDETGATVAPESETVDDSDGAGAGVLNVPDDHPTIQAAVDAAAPGDLVLIAPGTYHEAVDVTTDRLTIRGLDRNEVVLDGEFELDNAIRVLGASGVAVENMTAQNYARNGFYWTGVTGYRGSYLTSYRTGDYGIYAFDSVHGLFEHSYAAGSADAGYYIGQCFPCDAVIDSVVSEHNGLGYSGTNAGGNLLIINSTFRFNRTGVVPNSGSYQLCYPARETTIVGNLVYSNNQPDTPAISVALLAMGNGILPAGGVRNVIERNRVWDHDRTGIGFVPFLEETPNDDVPDPENWDRPCAEQRDDPLPDEVPDVILWDAFENRVIGNVVSDSREADLAVASAGGDISTFGNCFSDNDFTTSAPERLEMLAPCDGEGEGDWTVGDLEVIRWLAEVDSRPPSVDYREAPLPPRPVLDDMPDAATAPARAAVDVPPAVDLAAIEVPDAP